MATQPNLLEKFNNMKRSISIIIATFNRKDYLKKILFQILSQEITSDFFRSINQNEIVQAEAFLSENKNNNNNKILSNLNQNANSLNKIKNLLDNNIEHSESEINNQTITTIKNMKNSNRSIKQKNDKQHCLWIFAHARYIY